MKKIYTYEVTRQNLLQHFYILKIVSSFYTFSLTLNGSRTNGNIVFHDESGNSIYSQWDESSLLLMAWNHDCSNAVDISKFRDDEYDVSYVDGLPRKLLPWVKQGVLKLEQPAITSAIWCEEDVCQGFESWTKVLENGLNIFFDPAEKPTRSSIESMIKFFDSRGDAKLSTDVLDFVLEQLRLGTSKYFSATKEEIREGSQISPELMVKPTMKFPTFIDIRNARLCIRSAGIMVTHDPGNCVLNYFINSEKNVFYCEYDIPTQKIINLLQFDEDGTQIETTDARLMAGETFIAKDEPEDANLFRVPIEIRTSNGKWIPYFFITCDERLSSPKVTDISYAVDSLNTIFPQFSWSQS